MEEGKKMLRGGVAAPGVAGRTTVSLRTLFLRLGFCISSTMDAWASHRRRASCPSYKIELPNWLR